jgi:hypothetical protein
MTLSPITLKIAYKTSVSFPCLIVLSWMVGIFFPLEFADGEIELVYYSMCYYGLPISVLLTLTGIIKKEDRFDTILFKIFMIICASVLAMLLMTIIAFGSMCGWTTERELYEYKQIPTTKIILRSYGCGAVDSSPILYKVSEISQVTPYLIWSADIDTNKIDKSDWRRIEAVK